MINPILKVSAHEQRMYDDLKRTHLRFPGMVSKRVVKLLFLDALSQDHITTLRTEWLRLGLHELKESPK